MLGNFVDQSFVVVRASLTAIEVQRLVERLKPSHVIVAGAANEDSYHLFSTQEALALLSVTNAQTPVLAALGLEQRSATPSLDADDDELSAPDQAVVLDEGRVIGFVDFTAPPPPITKSGSTNAVRGIESVQPIARTLVTDFPGQVIIGETASLLVFISTVASEGQLPIAVPVGTAVDVIVKVRRGFELLGSREGRITVMDAEETQPLQFKFKATDVGLGAIQIFVFAEGRSLGSVTIESKVAASTDETGAGSHPKSGKSLQREKPLPIGEEAVPDLMLIIIEHQSCNTPHLTFRLKTREPYEPTMIKQEFGPVVINVEPQQHFLNFFSQIQNLPTDTDRDRRAAEHQLSNKGADLFDALFPEDLRDLLWTLRERIHSVQIQSQEPWIPWELCKLHGWEQGRIIEGQFFCEAFAITRWLPELADKLTLPLRRVALVVPAGSGLVHAEDEEEYIQSLDNGDRRVERIPATFEEILDSLASGKYDGWHFTCHGSAHSTNPDLAELELEAGDVLRPENLSGKVANVGLNNPLVFLNACQSGRGAMSLTGIGGWAQRFLRAAVREDHPKHGAAGFIGTYWKIDDLAALNFARAFYTALLQDKQSLGKAAQTARLAIRPLGGADWLAYTVFAHPLAAVK
jgi:hypothetical protein